MSNDRSSDQNPESSEPEFEAADEVTAEDALGAAAGPAIGTQAGAEPAAEIDSPTEEASEDDPIQSDSEETDSEFDADQQPAPKLERLQKILAQAGVASRRHAEELITGGHVEVNGQVVTILGSKADAARDHIRVDGKLLRGAERLRYFVLNKPKGFVTTAKDPEGRPTVMHFFEKMHERLYPVGRLDYQSEGLLLVTNDGELANKLTRAASGVEKTYLVKVSGQPTEAELDILRGGVAIDRSQPGAGKVNTAPARVRQVRQGDNPWYEVVLIEGRNRELRKMFQEIGHFVEKIRRVGYGPLVLDIEPGKLRELDPGEVAALRKAAEGKGRAPKSKEMRQRQAVDTAQLPTVVPRPSPRPARSFPAAKPFAKPGPKQFSKPISGPVRDRATPGRPSEFRPNKAFSPKKSFSQDRPFRPSPPNDSGERFNRNAGAGPAGFGPARPAFNATTGPQGPRGARHRDLLPAQRARVAQAAIGRQVAGHFQPNPLGRTQEAIDARPTSALARRTSMRLRPSQASGGQSRPGCESTASSIQSEPAPVALALVALAPAGPAPARRDPAVSAGLFATAASRARSPRAAASPGRAERVPAASQASPSNQLAVPTARARNPDRHREPVPPRGRTGIQTHVLPAPSPRAQAVDSTPGRGISEASPRLQRDLHQKGERQIPAPAGSPSRVSVASPGLHPAAVPNPIPARAPNRLRTVALAVQGARDSALGPARIAPVQRVESGLSCGERSPPRACETRIAGIRE
jgi:23S rRNA pseudouridine2605 synthase